jgi:poly-gamma-glutamate capsule biosynthesis protein CapA/YwtB (metallophosphatase superfamily)
MTTLALAGDTMLGRGVAQHLGTHPVRSLFGEDLLEILADTDGMLVNLECCISERGAPWPGRVFHFRAPPIAVDALNLLGVRWVTLANNHALDYGEAALLDTLGYLGRAGIAAAGAGESTTAARAPVRIDLAGTSVTLLSFTDHPADYDAGSSRPGVAYADIQERLPAWLGDAIRRFSVDAAPVLVSPHWGPNMTPRPLSYVRRAAADLRAAGATLIAGHSAHVFHGVSDDVLYDLGDFLDDYATDPVRRNDLGLLWLLSLEGAAVTTVEAVPLHLGYCRTTVARGDDADWVRRRFRQACAELGTDVAEIDGRLRVHRVRSGSGGAESQAGTSAGDV